MRGGSRGVGGENRLRFGKRPPARDVHRGGAPRGGWLGWSGRGYSGYNADSDRGKNAARLLEDTIHATDRGDQPEGRGREDDHDREPRGRPRRRPGKRVCVIDLDPQAHASTHLGVEPDGTIPSLYDVLVANKPLAEVRRQVEREPVGRCRRTSTSPRPRSNWPASSAAK